MLKLYQFVRSWGIPNQSHFCCKLETYLRMAGIAHEIETTLPMSGPKRKLPYVKDGDTILGDSGFIVQYLKKSITIWIRGSVRRNWRCPWRCSA